MTAVGFPVFAALLWGSVAGVLAVFAYHVVSLVGG